MQKTNSAIGCLILWTSCRKLFELLVLSGALAELTWPAILSKRHIFRCSTYLLNRNYWYMIFLSCIIFYREVFVDFDPVLVSKLSEKKIVAPGSTASSLLSEPKLRTIIENARQTLKVCSFYSFLFFYVTKCFFPCVCFLDVGALVRCF